MVSPVYVELIFTRPGFIVPNLHATTIRCAQAIFFTFFLLQLLSIMVGAFQTKIVVQDCTRQSQITTRCVTYHLTPEEWQNANASPREQRRPE